MYALIDENFPEKLAIGLNSLQEPLNVAGKDEYEVVSIPSLFGQGAKDEEWIPEAGKLSSIVITQDLKIQTTRHQCQLYQKHGLGIFFFKAPSKTGYSYWDMVQQIVKRWDTIKQLTRKTKLPFAYRCTSNSNFKLLE